MENEWSDTVPVYEISDYSQMDSVHNGAYIIPKGKATTLEKLERIKKYRLENQGLVDCVDDTGQFRQVLDRDWVRIYHHRGTYFLYDRCDGESPQYRICDSRILSFKRRELEYEEIIGFSHAGDSAFYFFLKADSAKAPEGDCQVSIERLDREIGIYLWRWRCGYMNYKIACVRLADWNKFDVIVNNCVYEKAVELVFAGE
ncbi:MAG: hypothetical protein D6722_14160 [Bacteroidetes bacterium]|nr:MAG: hypothetical protein D6722_14160 [Bacteroidota bacterium]